MVFLIFALPGRAEQWQIQIASGTIPVSPATKRTYLYIFKTISWFKQVFGMKFVF
jgi:hypothetical protein